jgi:hypothetical protein
MTRDDFRKFQKRYCRSGAPNKVGIYGCSCCRVIGNLADFKRWARKQAKVLFRRETRVEIAGARIGSE